MTKHPKLSMARLRYSDGTLCVDPEFDPDENLYFRVHPENWNDDELELDAIRMPDMSTNREKYSEAEWVVRPCPGWGIARILVRHVPSSQASLGVIHYTFRVEHDPRDDSYRYCHCEIRVYDKSGTFRIKDATYDDGVDLLWRERFSREVKLVRRPDYDAYSASRIAPPPDANLQ